MASLIIFLFLAAILSSSSIQAQAAQLHNDFRKCLFLHSTNSKGLYTSNNLRLLPSTSTPGPQAIVAPGHESQIQSVVLCAKKMGMQIQTRSGGHDLTSATSRDPFIILDLVNLNEISVDADSKTAWVQAGATLEQLNSGVSEKSKNLAVPAGIGSTSGVGGHFSGSDHIVNARVVDVEGRILDRESMGKNLFLAIRGAGILTASFGVITAYKVNLVTVPEIISLPSDIRTLEQAATERKWQSTERIVEDLNHIFLKLGDSCDDLCKTFVKCVISSNPEIIFANIFSYKTNLGSSIRNLRFKSSTEKLKLIITPDKEEQFKPVICCAKESGIQLRTRSGGHDYEGCSYVSEVPYAILDMKNFNTIEVDVDQKTAWVGAGTTLGELYYKINEKSDGTLGFPGGACPTVGAGGLISGGGYGMMTRKYGVAADRVTEARIIVANGTILDSSTMHHDLLWAIRGGGGASFGVILKWKLKLVEVPEQVTVFNISRIMDENEKGTELVDKWQRIADSLDDDLFLRVLLRKAKTPANSESEVRVSATFEALFLGGAIRLMAYMQEKFPELGLSERDCKRMSWIQSVLFFDRIDINANLKDVLTDRAGRRTPKYLKVKSDYVPKPIEPTKLGLFTKWFSKEDVNVRIFLSPNGGKMYEFSESEIAFPHRKGSVYSIEYMVHWDKEGDSGKNLEWIKDVYGKMVDHVSKPTRYAYLNDRDLDIGRNMAGETSYEDARQWGERYFKNNFKKLTEVKMKVDPGNFFKNEQSIPIISPSAPPPGLPPAAAPALPPSEAPALLPAEV